MEWWGPILAGLLRATCFTECSGPARLIRLLGEASLSCTLAGSLQRHRASEHHGPVIRPVGSTPDCSRGLTVNQHPLVEDEPRPPQPTSAFAREISLAKELKLDFSRHFRLTAPHGQCTIANYDRGITSGGRESKWNIDAWRKSWTRLLEHHTTRKFGTGRTAKGRSGLAPPRETDGRSAQRTRWAARRGQATPYDLAGKLKRRNEESALGKSGTLGCGKGRDGAKAKKEGRTRPVSVWDAVLRVKRDDIF